MGKTNTSFYSKERGLKITRLMSRDGDKCQICGNLLDRRIRDIQSPSYITFDHILPSSKGGLTVPSNLRLVHYKCNQERGNSLVVDFFDTI